MLESKKGSIFNHAIVPLPLRTQLLWACSLQAGVARSGSERAQRTSSEGVAHCVCDQHSAAAMVKVPTGETTLDIDTKLAEDYCRFFLT